MVAYSSQFSSVKCPCGTNDLFTTESSSSPICKEESCPFEGYYLSERNPEENLAVDIIIGADQYWNIANGEVKRGESGPCCNEHKILMDLIWSCQECILFRDSFSQFGSSQR